VIGMINDGVYALLATLGCLGVGLLAFLWQKYEPARLRARRERREARKSAIAELHHAQAEALVEAHDDAGADDQALLRYLELENSIETAKRT